MTPQLSVQMGMIDLQTMVWAFVAAWTPPNSHLSLTKPTMKLCSKRIIVPIIEVLVLAVVTHAACFALLNSADWYQGSHTGSHIQVRSIIKFVHAGLLTLDESHIRCHIMCLGAHVLFWCFQQLI